MKPLALYLHVPFCAAKCAYCDFASFPNRLDACEAYLCAVEEELASWRGDLRGCEAHTVFLGGGTPSLMSADWLERLMSAVRGSVRVHPDAEITMEANPGTLSEDKLRRVRTAGVNRLSIGAQSFNDALLKAIGRIHTAEQTVQAVRMARRAGFDNVSLDLMYGLPGQTAKDWLRTLDAAIALSPEHISAYSLIVEEGTPLERRVRRGETQTPDEDDVIEMQRAGINRLERAGYARYEISNYARPGRECRHNVVYWRRGDYLGVGCAAHSLMDGVRFANPQSLDDYLAGQRGLDRCRLSRSDEMEETLMLSTRMTQGLNLEAWRAQFGEDFLAPREDRLNRLRRAGLVDLRDGYLSLTQRGLEVQDAVVLDLLD